MEECSQLFKSSSFSDGKLLGKRDYQKMFLMKDFLRSEAQDFFFNQTKFMRFKINLLGNVLTVRLAYQEARMEPASLLAFL